MHLTRRRFVISSTALLAGAALAPSALARLPRRAASILDWTRQTEHTLTNVKLNLGSNCLIVASDGHVLLVDSKFPYLGPVLLADAKAHGEHISLVNTHHHGDHTGGNSAFVGNTPTYAHPKALTRIKGQIGNYRSGAEGAVGQAAQNFRGSTQVIEMAQNIAESASSLKDTDFVPKKTVSGGDAIEVGGLTVNVHHFGAGHTDNDIVLRLESENILHTGDLVFNGLHPYYDPAGGATARGWINSLERIESLCDAETIVVPGHGEVGGKGIVTKMRNYHEQLIDAVQAEIDKGTSKEDAQQMMWDFMEGLQFEQVKGRAVGAVYDELKAE